METLREISPGVIPGQAFLGTSCAFLSKLASVFSIHETKDGFILSLTVS